MLDNFRSGRRENIEGLGCRFVHGSVLDRDLMRELAEGVDRIFHLAALASVPESISNPLETVSINITGLLNVLEAAREAGVRRFVFASSAAVYGEETQQPAVESSMPAPRSPYAITKMGGEYFCSLYAREGWVSTASVRLFNVFGPRQNPRGSYAAAVPGLLAKALDGRPLTIYGDGSQTRDFIYVKDVVRALDFIAESEQAGCFNAGGGRPVALMELAEKILELTGAASLIEHQPSRAGDIRHSIADTGKLSRAGWLPRYAFEEALGEMAATIRAGKGPGL